MPDRPPILVVEDDAPLRQFLQEALEDAGFAVTAAVHGAEALRLLRSCEFVAVVLDLVLPWVSGLEVLATMRSEPPLAPIPVIVVTATVTLEQDLRVFPPVAVVRKPFEVATVIDALRQHLEREGNGLAG